MIKLIVIINAVVCRKARNEQGSLFFSTIFLLVKVFFFYTLAIHSWNIKYWLGLHAKIEAHVENPESNGYYISPSEYKFMGVINCVIIKVWLGSNNFKFRFGGSKD